MNKQDGMEYGRVLIVDDEPDFVANLSDILSDVGFSVEGTTSPLQALEWVATREYDAAVLDFRMPGLDGLRLHERMRHSRRDVPTILLTAYADHETQNAAREAGFWSILEKPCQIPAIRSLLHTLTRSPTVLLVDDDPDFCANLLQILHQQRIRATACTSVSEAIARWNRRPADILLLDLKFPGESAMDLLRHIQASRSQADVHLITGANIADSGELRQMLESGSVPVWQKPLDIAELIAKLPVYAHVGLTSHER